MLLTHVLTDFFFFFSPFFYQICDEDSGLVCDIQSEVCSSPCSNGENCCSVFFEPKDSTGCDVADDTYCTAASKGKISEYL